MNFLFPLIHIVGESIATTTNKLNFTKNRISSQQLMFLIFLAMTGSLLLFVILTKQPFPTFSAVSLGLVSLIALVSFGGNVFDFLSLKADDLSLREPMTDFQPILAGLVGYLLFPSEREVGFLVAFILSTFIVYWGSHQRKLRTLQRKGLVYFALAITLYALLPSIYKLTLVYISPEYIALFRVSAILVLSTVFFPDKKLQALSGDKMKYGFSSGVFHAIAAVAGLYAIETLGVLLTMLLFMLRPTLNYLVSYFVLKEEVRRGEIISSILLTVVVLLAVVL